MPKDLHWSTKHKTTHVFFSADTMATRHFALICLGVAALGGANAKWTVLVYMNGDNNLEEFVGSDLTEMSNAGSQKGGLDIFVLADRNRGYFSGDRRSLILTGPRLDRSPRRRLPERARLDRGAVLSC
jgi:hypothetical protein